LQSIVLCGIEAIANISATQPLPRIIKPIGQPPVRADASNATKIHRPPGWLIQNVRV
jgi:hypothetical protein